MITENRYVLGFLMDDRRVVLIRKTRPDWQAGRLNGVGGKIEPDETPYDAMQREFREETGVDFAGWKSMGRLRNIQDGWHVELFYAFVDDVLELGVRTMTDEEVAIRSVDGLSRDRRVIQNVPWLIEMARSFSNGERAAGFLINEY